MSPSASSTAPYVVIGNPGNRRVDMFQAALTRAGYAPARVVPYADLLAGRIQLAQVVTPGAIVRIESPDKSFEVERAILLLGADAADEDGDYARVSRAELEALEHDKGAILYPRQWYLGYCEALRLIQRQLAECPPHRLMSTPAGIATMFDKSRTHALLAANGIPVPQGLGRVGSYDELRERMSATGCNRVFVKLAHGSSASGVVAYQVSRDRHMATTTVELAATNNGYRLYNSKRIRTYRDPQQIAALIDALCRHRVHVERWFPKASIGDRLFDLRVVVIAGWAQHVVVRLSRTTLTNLHLDNARAGLDLLLTRLDRAAWDAARSTCEQLMRLFPASLYAGIDLLISSDYRRHAVAEVNAFGDLLLDTVWQGRDTYQAEIEALAPVHSVHP